MYRNRLTLTYLVVLLASECWQTKVPVQRSTISHARAENGVFASRNFEKNGAAKSYYGSLASANLERELRSKRQYGERYMNVTAKSFSKWAVELERVVSVSEGQNFCVWLLPTPFSAMRYINAPWYREEDREETTSRKI